MFDKIKEKLFGKEDKYQGNELLTTFIRGLHHIIRFQSFLNIINQTERPDITIDSTGEMFEEGIIEYKKLLDQTIEYVNKHKDEDIRYLLLNQLKTSVSIANSFIKKLEKIENDDQSSLTGT